jgi:hypothetical protein
MRRFTRPLDKPLRALEEARGARNVAPARTLGFGETVRCRLSPLERQALLMHDEHQKRL